MIEDLIYDVGMHQGKDTEFYLRKGFRVVAIEANPELAQVVRNRLSAEVESGRLTILELAITDRVGLADFFVATEEDFLSSLFEESLPPWSARKRIQVKCETFDTILREHGIPYYLKIDIEGADISCIRKLRDAQTKPQYVSFECSTNGFESAFEGLAELYTMGYRRFKLVNGARIIERRCPNPPREGKYVDMKFDGHSSGPFGEETAGQWLAVEEIIEKCLQLGKQQVMRKAYIANGRVLGIPLQRYHSLVKTIYNAHIVKMFRRGYCALLRREIGGWFDIHARYGG